MSISKVKQGFTRTSTGMLSSMKMNPISILKSDVCGKEIHRRFKLEMSLIK
jgi:hypothetical protein